MVLSSGKRMRFYIPFLNVTSISESNFESGVKKR